MCSENFSQGSHVENGQFDGIESRLYFAGQVTSVLTYSDGHFENNYPGSASAGVDY